MKESRRILIAVSMVAGIGCGSSVGSAPAPAAQDEDWKAAQEKATLAAAIDPVMDNCPADVAAMVKGWQTAPPGELARLVSSWREAPAFKRRDWGDPERWGSWETTVRHRPAGGGEAEERQGQASSTLALDGRLLVESFSEDVKVLISTYSGCGVLSGVMGEKDGGFVSVLVRTPSCCEHVPCKQQGECHVLEGARVGDEIRFGGDGARRTFGEWSQSLELPAGDGGEALEIVFEPRATAEDERAFLAEKARSQEEMLAKATRPLVEKCPQLPAMIERWRSSPPGELAKLVTAWLEAPVIQRNYFDRNETDEEWGPWKAVVRHWPAGSGEMEWELEGESQTFGAAGQGQGLSLPSTPDAVASASTAETRLLLDVLAVRKWRSNPGPGPESWSLVAATGPEDGGFVTVLAHDSSPDCIVLQGARKDGGLHFEGERGRRQLGLRSQSLELLAPDGAKAVEIVYERDKIVMAYSRQQQSGCLDAGAEDCFGDGDCCGELQCLEVQEEGTGYDGKPMLIIKDVCKKAE